MFALLLVACTDDDSGGTHWDPTSDSWWSTESDTGVPDTDTDGGPTGDTAEPLPTADTGFTTSISCNGDGPATLEVGTGGRSAFDAYSNGELLPIVQGPASGEWGVTFEVLTAGLDTTQPVTAVMRLDTPRTDTTYIGVLQLQCSTPGPGWVSFHADFKNEDQADAASGQYDGDDAIIDLTLTDHTNESAELDITLELDGP